MAFNLYKNLPYPFADAGDKTPIPIPTDGSGLVSLNEGYGPLYEEDQVDPDALNIERNKYNYILNVVTAILRDYQQHGIPEFITTTDNNGSPNSYGVNAQVRWDDGGGVKNYISLVDANTALPSDGTKWQRIIYSNQEDAGVGKEYWGTTLLAGYVWQNGTTVGNAASGATGRANADCLALFSVLWQNPNSTFPIQNSDGSVGTRGINALADFNAGKRLPTPDKRGRVGVGKDDMGGVTAAGRVTNALSGIAGTTMGASGGIEAVALVASQNGSHAHDVVLPVAFNTGAGGARIPLVSGPYNSQHQYTNTSNGDGVQSSGNGDPHQNMQPSIVCNYIIKL